MAEKDPYAHLATNPESKFSDFSIRLQNGATLTGIAYIPPRRTLSVPPPARPLLIGIHGATCSAHAWDLTPTCTASQPAELASTPFVAFHRPNFLRSSGWLLDNAPDASSHPAFHAAEGRSFFEEEARWYHEYILPALWENFGPANGCASLVTTSHSMSVPITIIAAGLFSAQPAAARAYPWAGMVITGFGEVRTEVLVETAAGFATNRYGPGELPYGHDPGTHVGPFLRGDKIALMMGPEGCCDGALHEPCYRQTTPFFREEIVDMVGMWVERKERYRAGVRIPVLHALGSLDWIWRAEREFVDAFGKGFVNAPRVEGAVVEGAPHAIEYSRMRAAWWMRVMGWAAEVSTSEEVRKLGLRPYV